MPITCSIYLHFTHVDERRMYEEYLVEYFPRRVNKNGKQLQQAYLFFSPINKDYEKECFKIPISHFRDLVTFVDISEALE